MFISRFTIAGAFGALGLIFLLLDTSFFLFLSSICFSIMGPLLLYKLQYDGGKVSIYNQYIKDKHDFLVEMNRDVYEERSLRYISALIYFNRLEKGIPALSFSVRCRRIIIVLPVILLLLSEPKSVCIYLLALPLCFMCAENDKSYNFESELKQTCTWFKEEFEKHRDEYMQYFHSLLQYPDLPDTDLLVDDDKYSQYIDMCLSNDSVSQKTKDWLRTRPKYNEISHQLFLRKHPLQSNELLKMLFIRYYEE